MKIVNFVSLRISLQLVCQLHIQYMYYVCYNIALVSAREIQIGSRDEKAKALTTVARSFLIPFPTVHNGRDHDERGRECLPRCDDRTRP